MGQASETEVRAVLPKRLEDVPGSSDITDFLEIARLKVDNYDLTDSDQKWAEAYYAAYRLVKDKWPLPQAEDEGGVSSEYSEDPAQSLYDSFQEIAKDGGDGAYMRIV